MKSISFHNILDQKRFLSHLMIVVLSLIAVAILTFGKISQNFPEDQLYIFFLILIQMELFILLGNRIFARMKLVSTGKELTRMVLTRFSIFIAICFFLALIIVLLFTYFINIIHGYNPGVAISNFLKYGFGGWVKGTISGLFFGAVLFIFLQWQDALKREQKLKEQNLIFQNETLKNQVNPHFLFNSLNTLSSLVISSPEIAEEFINKLSSIYRYILENSSKDCIPLEAELSFIYDYFYLHKIRDEGKIELEIKISEADKYGILPISIQGLVENSIKHNMATRERPLKILIFIDEQHIVVKNNLQKMTTQVRSTGIGLRNLSERVKLLTGKDIVVEETKEYFTVKLPLIS